MALLVSGMVIKVTSSTEYINHLNKTMGKDFLQKLLSNEANEEFLRKINKEIDNLEKSKSNRINEEDYEEEQENNIKTIKSSQNKEFTKIVSKQYQNESLDQQGDLRRRSNSNSKRSNSKSNKIANNSKKINNVTNTTASMTMSKSKSKSKEKKSKNSSSKEKIKINSSVNNTNVKVGNSCQPDNFEKSLRKYQKILNTSSNTSGIERIKEFNNHTTPYGKYFDKNIYKDTSKDTSYLEQKEKVDKSINSLNNTNNQSYNINNYNNNNNNPIKIVNDERLDTKQSFGSKHSLSKILNEKGALESTIEQDKNNYGNVFKEIPCGWKSTKEFFETEEN